MAPIRGEDPIKSFSDELTLKVIPESSIKKIIWSNWMVIKKQRNIKKATKHKIVQK